MPPAERLRVELAAARAAGVEFDRAWRRALVGFELEWQAAFESTGAAWKAAWHREPATPAQDALTWALAA